MSALLDAAERERISHDTAATLFVNAGAGSGKTTALVSRVRSLVLDDGVPLAHIAAVTFTEKAGAELRDRLRAEFTAAGGAAATQALDELDQAAIGTLHSFAQRILTAHPIEAGLPPMIEVLDEVGSSVAFEERWSQVRAALLDDDAIAQPLLLAMALGMELKHIRSLTLALGRDWDLIEERILRGEAPVLQLPDVEEFASRAAAFVKNREHCTKDDDKLLPRFADLQDLLGFLSAAPDLETRLGFVKAIGELSFRHGQKPNWTRPVAQIRAEGTDLAAAARALVGGVLDSCLRLITRWVAERVLESAHLRRGEGRLEFHDLLVLSRDLLRRDAAVRAALHEEYQRLLLDEFQDTDPIQIELAVRICAGEDAGAARWQEVPVPDGRLFVVGDAKQSIYKFRRASIGTYLEAQERIGEPASLTTNFRSAPPVLDWINGVFARLIRPAEGGQPEYLALDAHRPDTGAGPAVTVLGARAHEDRPHADEMRLREAADVAAVIRQTMEQGWTVFDERSGQWRPARHDDIAVLLPARTSLPFLEDALDAAGVPYRAEASSLVYQGAEIRSLLAAARAVADTSDALSLVTALRSPLFGCGDDDLWRWKHGGGAFSIWSRSGPDGPVGEALAYLRELYAAARWMAPSQVLSAIVADRRMFEVAATGPRARDSWRRLRFVVDQARAWSEVSHGGLRAYLAWAAHQGQEVARVAEAVLPETDADAVRVMTIHAAKGLEFPIVVLSGMTSQGRGGSGVSVLWTADGGYAVKLARSVQTGDFEAAVPIDEQLDEYEKLRLLYVAATRARDHLVVSLHRSAASRAGTAAAALADAGAAEAAIPFTGYAFARRAEQAEPARPPAPRQQWLASVQLARERSRATPAISASGLEGTEPAVVLDDAADGRSAGAAKGARNLDLPPWTKGRYGSAIGRAVHAVLQTIDLATGAGLVEAVAAQAVAEGVVGQEELVGALVESALGSEPVRQAAAREHWRETYVGTVRSGGTILEGYVDLIYRDGDGALVIVDYKTDAVPAGGIPSRVAYYRPQLDAYCEALAAATNARVRARLLFLNPGAAVAVTVRE